MVLDIHLGHQVVVAFHQHGQGHYVLIHIAVLEPSQCLSLHAWRGFEMLQVKPHSFSLLAFRLWPGVRNTACIVQVIPALAASLFFPTLARLRTQLLLNAAEEVHHLHWVAAESVHTLNA